MSSLTPPENIAILEKFKALYEEAVEKNKVSQACTYRKIIQSLNRYPLPIKSGADALRLVGVGRGTVSHVAFDSSAFIFGVTVVRDASSIEVSLQETQEHRERVFLSMKQFAEHLESDMSLEFEYFPAEKNHKKMRLTTGSSAWSILLAVYMFSHQFFQGELTQSDILKAAEALCHFDSRLKISNWKAVSKLVLGGYLSSRDPVLSSPRNNTRGSKTLYCLTPLGRSTGETLLCAVDLPTGDCVPKMPPFNVASEVNPKTHQDAYRWEEESESLQPHSSKWNEVERDPYSSLSLHVTKKNPVQPNAFVSYVSSPNCPSFSSKNKYSTTDPKDECTDKPMDYCSEPDFTSFSLHKRDWYLTQVDDESSTMQSLNNTAHGTAEVDKDSAQQQPITAEEELLSSLVRYIRFKDMPVDGFNICCLVDYREINGAGMGKKNRESCNVRRGKTQRGSHVLDNALIDMFRKGNVRYELTPLPIGDFAWVCRVKKPKELLFSHKLCSIVDSTVLGSITCPPQNREGYHQNIDFILPYLVERKTVADFLASIVDGRYEDQKFRLLRSPGIKCIIYLVEGTEQELFAAYSKMNLSSKVKPLSTSTVRSAIATTQIRNGIHVVFSYDLVDTAMFLITIQKHLERQVHTFVEERRKASVDYIGKFLLGNLIAECPLRQIWTSRSKRLVTVHDVLGRQLRSIEFIGERTVIFLLNHFHNVVHLKDTLHRYPRNSKLRSALYEKALQDTGAPGKPKCQRTLLTTRVLTALRELYAPSTLPLSSTPQLTQTANQSRLKKRFFLSKDVRHAPNIMVHKRLRS